MGMNESILTSPQDAIGTRVRYESITENFDQFMADFFGVDITNVIKDQLVGKKLPQFGEVFQTEFVLEHALCSEFEELEGQSFTVLFYVNSRSEGRIVEEPRITTLHLVDAASNCVYNLRKGRTVDVTLVLPAIGTGKTGKGPYKHIVYETLNNLALPNYALPNRVVLSLRDYPLLGPDLEAERVLSQAKKAFFD